LEELEAALLRIAVNPPPSLREQLQADERGLIRAVKRVLPEREEIELLLVIDQLEEVFTLVADEGARLHFLANLCAAAADPRSRVRIITTLRADFYDRPLLYPDPGELVRQRTEVVLPLTSDELYQAIIGPAERVGVGCEAELVAAILQDVGAQPGTLPLLQYALTEVFERRAGPTMTMAAYRETGGVLGALARRTEETYAGLSSGEQALARQVFLRLVTLGEGVEDTRRRVRLSELSALAADEATLEGVLTGFGRHRLLTFDRDARTGEATVEVAHEAMLRAWPRLREWLEASREDLRAQRRLLQEAADWAAAGHDAGLLTTSTRLAQFEGLAAAGNVALTTEERAYLAASVAERDRQAQSERARQARELALQKRAASRLRVLVAALAVFLAVALALSGWAVNRSQAADDNAQQARSAAATAVANENEAELQRGLAVKSEATVAANLTRSEAQRLAAQASTLIQASQFPETAALLSLRSMNTLYTPEGDAALLQAATLQFPLRQFPQQPNDGALVAAFSPDGRYLVTAGNATSIAHLWDVASATELHPGFVGHTDGINSVAFSPDGTQVLTAGGDGDKTARLWDALTGRPLRVLPHPDAVNRAIFSPDGRYILTGSRDKIARLWDRQTGAELRRFPGHTDRIRGLAFSPDGKWIVTTGGADRTARLWDVQTGESLRMFTGHTGRVTSVDFSPDGTTVLTGSDDQTARLWDATTGAALRTFTGHSAGVQDIAFSPDGKLLATASIDNTARLWDPTTGVEVNRFFGRGGMHSVLFAPNGESLLTGSNASIAHLWAARRPPFTVRLTHVSVARNVKFSADGNLLLTANVSNSNPLAYLWDAPTGVELRRFAGHTAGIDGVVFSPDGKMVVTAANNPGFLDRTLRLWDAQTARQTQIFTLTFGLTNTRHALAFAPNGTQVLLGGSDHVTHLLDLQTGREVGRFQGHSDDVESVAFSPDGTRVVTASTDKGVKIWDFQTRKEVLTLTGHTAAVHSAVFSPDGTLVLTAAADGTARLWDAQTGQEVHRYTGHAGVVWEAVMSADGRWIATSGDDTTARLWDVPTGQEVRRFVGHTAAIRTLAISPDGQTVATASDDFTVRVWQTDYHAAVRYLCARVPRDFTDQERAQYGIPDQDPTCPAP
jgi:WD40 repeat protein